MPIFWRYEVQVKSHWTLLGVLDAMNFFWEERPGRLLELKNSMIDEMNSGKVFTVTRQLVGHI